MARFAVFSILLVAVALSGVCGGLIPNDIVPINIPVPEIPDLTDIITPKSRADAISKCERGVSTGKSGINLRISAFIAANARDPTLTPVCKRCIAEKSNEIRKQTIDGIDATGNAIVEKIKTSASWLSIWILEIRALPELILNVVTDCEDSLNTAKSGCIASTATA